MKLGLMLHDPEEEHDCFSDNTHNSHYYDEVGMIAIWNGSYTRIDGTVVEGPASAAIAAAKAPEAKAAVDARDGRDAGQDAGAQGHGRQRQDGLRPDDGRRQCGRQPMVQDAVDALVAQTRAVEAVVAALGLKIEVEGSDSLDNPSAVGQ